MKKTLMALGVLSIVSCGIDTVTAMRRPYQNICFEKEQLLFGDNKYHDRVEKYSKHYAADLRNLFMRSATCDKVKECYKRILKLDTITYLCQGLDAKFNFEPSIKAVLIGTWEELKKEDAKQEFKNSNIRVLLCWNAYNRHLEKEVDKQVKNFLQSIMNACIYYSHKWTYRFSVNDVICKDSIDKYLIDQQQGDDEIFVHMLEDLKEEKNFTDLTKYTEDFLNYLEDSNR